MTNTCSRSSLDVSWVSSACCRVVFKWKEVRRAMLHVYIYMSTISCLIWPCLLSSPIRLNCSWLVQTEASDANIFNRTQESYTCFVLEVHAPHRCNVTRLSCLGWLWVTDYDKTQTAIVFYIVWLFIDISRNDLGSHWGCDTHYCFGLGVTRGLIRVRITCWYMYGNSFIVGSYWQASWQFSRGSTSGLLEFVLSV